MTSEFTSEGKLIIKAKKKNPKISSVNLLSTQHRQITVLLISEFMTSERTTRDKGLPISLCTCRRCVDAQIYNG